MKIIIPLVGSSDSDNLSLINIKPLIKINEEHLITKFIENFNLNFEYIFLCNLSDLINTELLDVINKLKVKKKIIPITEKTNNVIETVLKIQNKIKNTDNILIGYPDCILRLNKIKLLKKIKNNKIKGLLAGYNNFNPSFSDNDYVGRVKLKNNKIISVNEKSNSTGNNATLTGLYYFSKWSDFKIYAKKTFINQKSINGKFYISQIYNEYIKDNKNIEFFEINNFVSLGSNKNINEYNFWSKYFFKNSNKKYKKTFDHINLIPACGEGKRFAELGYKTIKPLIQIQKNIWNKSMLDSTLNSLPKSKKNIIIIKKTHEKIYKIKNKFKSKKNIKFIELSHNTQGMAKTCMYAKDDIPLDKPLIISSCDYSIVYNENKLDLLIKTINPDVIIWTFREYPDARLNPYAYAYLKTKNGFVDKISEKVPISDEPHKDDIVQGIFYFRKASLFFKSANLMFKKKNTINGEYYVANAINELIDLKYKVVPFKVDQYICWGTPYDLENYNFWNNFLHNKL